LPKVASFVGVGRDLQPVAAALVGLLGASSCGAAGAGTGSSTPAPSPASTTTRSDPAPARTTIPSGKAPIASTVFQLAAIAESPEDAWFAACSRSFVLGSSQRARIAELLQSLGTPDRAP
jgi:hypothetical protein